MVRLVAAGIYKIFENSRVPKQRSRSQKPAFSHHSLRRSNSLSQNSVHKKAKLRPSITERTTRNS